MARRRVSRSTASDGGPSSTAGPGRRTPRHRARAGESRIPRGTEAAAPEDAARDAAFRWLARAARSGAEVERYLARRGFASGVVSRTLQGLRDLRYVDDAALARRRAEDLMLQRGWGRLRVAHELTRRGLADSVIETAIAVILQDRTDMDLARAALERRVARRPLVSADDRARAFRYLTGRGHPADAVYGVLGEDD